VPPAGTSLLTAAASPAKHASYSARAGMCGMLFRASQNAGLEHFGRGGGGAQGGVRKGAEFGWRSHGSLVLFY